MALAPPLTLQLTQTKRFTGDAPRTERFAVQSVIVPSTPTTNRLDAAFVIGPAVGVDRERMLRVINLEDPTDAALVSAGPSTVNPLNCFRDDVVDLSAVCLVGDTIRVSLPPGEWSGALGPTPTMDFMIQSLDGPNQRVKTVTPFLWSALGLTYTVLAPDLVTVRTGPHSVGRTERENTALIEWRDTQVTMAFLTSTEAFDYIASVQAYMASLGKQVKRDVDAFLDTGGNPIVNTY